MTSSWWQMQDMNFWSFSNSEALRAHQRPLGPFGPREMLATLAFRWGFLVSSNVSRLKSCSFKHPNKRSNSSEFRSTQILINLWPFSIFAVDWMILEVWGGLFVSINFRPCSFGSLQRRHWRCWFMSPTQNMSPASSTRQSDKRCWGKERYSNCMSLLGCSCTVSDVMMLLHSFMFHAYLVNSFKVGLYVFDGLKHGWNCEFAFGKN